MGLGSLIRGKNKNQKLFDINGYVLVRDAISKDLCDFISQYALFDEIQDFTPDGMQVPDAHSKYGDPAMESLLLKLQPLMEENTGLTLHPTYSYYRVYRNGDELKKHTDRESCEISCTLCFNYSYDSNEYNWPIFVDGHKLDLKPGDLAIYKGTEKEHWRNKFNIPVQNSFHIQGFFHYVNANGPYSQFKFDGRNAIGKIK